MGSKGASKPQDAGKDGGVGKGTRGTSGGHTDLLGPFLAVGWDHSPTHAGVIALDETGKLVDVAFLTPKVGEAKKRPGLGTCHPPEIRNCKERDLRDARRLFWSMGWTMEAIRQIEETAEGRPIFCAVEDYAFHTATAGAHRTGEFGGILRCALWNTGVRYRLHDPTSLKMAATDNGNADKDAVKAAVLEAWGLDFTRFGEPAEDLTDAYVLARMAWAEVEVRAGRLTLEALDNGMRRVFLRVTKHRPVALLSRPWLHKDAVFDG